MEDNLQLEIHQTFETLQPVATEWNQLISSDGKDIYLTYEWCRSWWKYYGTNKDLRVLMFREEGRLVGVLPLFIDSVRCGPITLRVVRFVNSIYTACVLHPPILNGFAERIFSASLSFLFGEANVDGFSFGQLAQTFSSVPELKESVRMSETPLLLEKETELACHTVLFLPSSLEAYLQGLTSNRRQHVKRMIRNIHRESGPIRIEELTSREEILAEHDYFESLYSENQHFRAQAGNFLETPYSEEFNLDLIDAFGPVGDWKLGLLKVSAGEWVIGYEFFFHSGERLHWRIAARRNDEGWQSRGVGIVSLYYLVDFAIRNGIKEIESGPGHYYYKVSMGGSELPMRSLLIVRNSTTTRLKVQFFEWLYLFLDLAYYRIWYKKILKKIFPKSATIPQYYLRCRL